MNPLFSIVIPTFNSVQYSKECVDSALCQTYTHLEVIVDDNTSQDGTTSQLIEAFGSDSRLKIHENREDLNIPHGWNRGIKHAKGEYVLLLHSDNVLHPRYVEVMVRFLERYRCQVGYSECHYFEGETPKELFEAVDPNGPIPCDVLAPGPRAVSYVFRFQRMVPTSCLAIRRSCFGDTLPFDPKYKWDPDMDLLSRLAERYGVLRVNSHLAAIRTHPGQVASWKDPVFSTQYRELLWREHERGKSETHHFLMDWAASNEDITKKLCESGAPFNTFSKYWVRWLKAEWKVFSHFAWHFARKVKSILLTTRQALKTRRSLKEAEAN